MRIIGLIFGILLLTACGGGDGDQPQAQQVRLKSLAYRRIIADKQGVALYLRSDGKGIVREVFPITVPPAVELTSLDLHGIALGEVEPPSSTNNLGEPVEKPIEKRVEFNVKQETWNELAAQAEDGPDGYDLLHTPDSRELEAERVASGAGKPIVRPGSPEDMMGILRLTFTDGTEKIWNESDADDFRGLLIFFRRITGLAEGKALLSAQPDEIMPYEKDYRPPGY